MQIEVSSIGDLCERVTVEQNFAVADGGGDSVPDWATYRKLWAAADVVSGKEVTLADRTTIVVNIKFTLRYRRDVDETMRIVWRNRKYPIAFIQPGDDKNFMYVFCQLQQ